MTGLLDTAAFLTFADRALLPPLIVAISVQFAVPAEEVGHALTAYVLGYAAAQLGWGAITGHVGRIKVVAASILLGVIGNLITVLAVEPVLLTIGRLVAGIGFAGTIPTILVYIGDTMHLSDRTRAAANLAAALSLGMTVGTAVGAVTGNGVLWRAGFAGVGILSIVLVVVLLRLPDPPPAVAQTFLPSTARVFQNGWAVGILLITLIEGALLVGVLNFLPVALALSGVDTVLAGIVTSVYGIAVIAWTRLVGRLTARLGSAAMLAIAGASATIGFGLVAWVLSPLTVGVSAVMLGLAWAFGHTQLQAWMTDAVADARPVGMSLFSVALFAGGAAGVSLGNVAVSATAFESLFIGAAAGAAVFAAVAAVVRSRYRPREG